jgi:hypothetical protein
MKDLKYFLYLDTNLINSLFSQYNCGVISSITNSQTTQTELSPKVSCNIGILKGEINTSDNNINVTERNIYPHHYIYDLLEQELLKELGNNDNIVKICGNLRIIDSRKVLDSLNNLKDLVAGIDAVNTFTKNSNDKNSVSSEMRSFSKESKKVSKLIELFSSNHLLAYIDNEVIPLDRTSVIGHNSAEFLNNCTLFTGDYILIGIKSTLTNELKKNNSNDILLSLGEAFSEMSKMIKISPIKPLAIYRIISTQDS